MTQMVNAAIYRVSDGEILRRVTCPLSLLDIQRGEGDEFFLNCPLDATHIIDNAPATIAPAPPTFEAIKADKQREISAAFNAQLAIGTPEGYQSDTGWMLYDAVEDLSNYERALNSLRLTGAGSKTIKVKSDPVFVTATVADLETIVKELTLHGEDLYAWKWALQARVDAATTPEELGGIRW